MKTGLNHIEQLFVDRCDYMQCCRYLRFVTIRAGVRYRLYRGDSRDFIAFSDDVNWMADLECDCNR